MGKKLKILLVDDEEIVRRMLASFLQQFYDVHIAEDVFEALQIVFGIPAESFPPETGEIQNFLKNQNKRFAPNAHDTFINYRPDMIIADIKMPKINGFDLVRILRNYFPSVPVLMITGFEAEGHSNDLDKLQILEILLKPFSPLLLLEKINGALMK